MKNKILNNSGKSRVKQGSDMTFKKEENKAKAKPEIKKSQNEESKTPVRTKSTISPTKPNSDVKLKFVNSPTFDADKFIKSQTEEVLRCVVCDKLLNSPLSCYKCSKAFCGACIKSELEAHSKCPSCFNIIFPDLLKPVDIESNEFFKNKELLCPFDRCRQLLNLQNARSHLEECIFNKVSNEKKQHINKIINLEDDSDPFLKTHMLNYLINVNSKCENYHSKNCKETTKTNNLDSLFLKESEFHAKLSDLKMTLEMTNDYLIKNMVDVARITKNTNEKLKNMINS